jgi:hypothetical protein
MKNGCQQKFSYLEKFFYIFLYYIGRDQLNNYDYKSKTLLSYI